MCVRPHWYLLWIPACLLVACSPSRNIQKYSYLVEPSASQSGGTASLGALPAPPSPIFSPKLEAKPVTLVEAKSAEPSGPGTLSRRDIQRVVRTALSYRGTPYRYGGMSSKGMDCSGLVCKAYQAVGRKLPRRAIDISRTGISVAMYQLQPGNLVFFDSKGGGRINHVGLVVSVSRSQVWFVHASTSRGVRQDNLLSDYWRPRFRKAIAL